MNCHQLHATSTSTVGDIKAYRALWRCQRRDRPSSPSSVAKADLWRGHASSAVPNGQPRKLSIVAWHFVSPECEVKKGQAAYVLSEDRDTCNAHSTPHSPPSLPLSVICRICPCFANISVVPVCLRASPPLFSFPPSSRRRFKRNEGRWTDGRMMAFTPGWHRCDDK